MPTYSEGKCSCLCDNNSWSNLNLLGRASCVPVNAHQAFCGVAFAVSMASLLHVIYHLRRQV